MCVCVAFECKAAEDKGNVMKGSFNYVSDQMEGKMRAHIQKQIHR